MNLTTTLSTSSTGPCCWATAVDVDTAESGRLCRLVIEKNNPVRPSSQSAEVICFLCEEKVRRGGIFCLECGHGGHLIHMRFWFMLRRECPSGCGCICGDHVISTGGEKREDIEVKPGFQFDGNHAEYDVSQFVSQPFEQNGSDFDEEIDSGSDDEFEDDENEDCDVDDEEYDNEDDDDVSEDYGVPKRIEKYIEPDDNDEVSSNESFEWEN